MSREVYGRHVEAETRIISMRILSQSLGRNRRKCLCYANFLMISNHLAMPERLQRLSFSLIGRGLLAAKSVRHVALIRI